MKIEANITALKRTKWQDYLVRFIFGGAVTALAGIIAKRYGPEIGGLFLATPAIFPAAATLLENTNKRRRGRVPEGRCGRMNWPASMLPALLWEALAWQHLLRSSGSYCRAIL